MAVFIWEFDIVTMLPDGNLVGACMPGACAVQVFEAAINPEIPVTNLHAAINTAHGFRI